MGVYLTFLCRNSSIHELCRTLFSPLPPPYWVFVVSDVWPEMKHSSMHQKEKHRYFVTEHSSVTCSLQRENTFLVLDELSETPKQYYITSAFPSLVIPM